MNGCGLVKLDRKEV